VEHVSGTTAAARDSADSAAPSVLAILGPSGAGAHPLLPTACLKANVHTCHSTRAREAHASGTTVIVP
jgi:hypothetical protein